MKLQRYFRRADLEAVCRCRRAVACVPCGCRTFDVEVMIFLLDSMREAADRAAAKKRFEASISGSPVGVLRREVTAAAASWCGASGASSRAEMLMMGAVVVVGAAQ